jgi:hypothetical protein
VHFSAGSPRVNPGDTGKGTLFEINDFESSVVGQFGFPQARFSMASRGIMILP